MGSYGKDYRELSPRGIPLFPCPGVAIVYTVCSGFSRQLHFLFSRLSHHLSQVVHIPQFSTRWLNLTFTRALAGHILLSHTSPFLRFLMDIWLVFYFWVSSGSHRSYFLLRFRHVATVRHPKVSPCSYIVSNFPGSCIVIIFLGHSSQPTYFIIKFL